ncbi:MAG: YciI family protein [Rubrivivax sp.]|mgnify:CR=1 FL=1|nr:YciI family protein [Rubrivivax sp.]MBK7262672.1 YciI family protein [Rubrivivax sp.]MBK8527380.1 YciI family protein [Rubrivivax sp.]
MRVMIIVRGNATSESGTLPDDSLMAAMASFHEELAAAGVLLYANGLKPTREAWRIRYGTDGQRHVVDGPFTESKELVAGYTLIQVRSRDEAMAWSSRFPAPFGDGQPAEIEVRPLYELDDFGGLPAAERFRRLESDRG